MRRSVVAILTVTAIGLLGAIQGFSSAGSKTDMCVPMGAIVLKAPEGVAIEAVGRRIPPRAAFRCRLPHLPPHLGADRADRRLHDLRLSRPGRTAEAQARRARRCGCRRHVLQERLPQVLHRLPQGHEGQGTRPAKITQDTRAPAGQVRTDILPGVPSQINFSGPERKGPEKFMLSLSMKSAATQTTEFVQ